MRTFLILVIIVTFCFGLLTPVFANDPKDKLFRGAANVLSAPLEVPQNIDLEWKQSNNAAVGIFAGFVKGLFWGLARGVSGLWDVVTFPFPKPADYNSVIQPEYVKRGVQSHFLNNK